MQTFPIGSLGGRYIHTNLHHFNASLASFGSPDLQVAAILDTTIDRQKKREDAMDSKLKAANVNLTTDLFIKYLSDLQEQVLSEFKAIKTVHSAAYRKSKATAWSPEVLKESSEKYLVPYLNSLDSLLERAAEQSGLNVEDIDKIIPGIHALQKRLDNRIEAYEAAQNEKEPTAKQIKGFVNYFKGEAYEGVAGAMIAEVLGNFTSLEKNNPGLTVSTTGMRARLSDGRKVKVDLHAKIADWGVDFGVSVKSTSLQTMKGKWGATLHSGTVGSVAKLMENSGLLDSSIEIDQFIYFLINLSRMSEYAQANRQPLSSANISDYPAYEQFIQDLAKVYTTFFIGDQTARGKDVTIPELFNVDILIFGDFVAKKSEILRKIKDGDMDVQLSLGGHKTLGKSFWEKYDDSKRSLMKLHKGNYASVIGPINEEYNAVEKLLPRPARISLHVVI